MIRTLSVSVCALLLALAGCSGDGVQGGGSGFIEANDAVVSAEISGRVMARLFDEGSRVHQGDTLAIIDTTRVRLDLASMEALRNTSTAGWEASKVQLEQARETERYARAERDRIAKLLADGSATQKQMDQLDHDYVQAVNARKAAEANVTMVQRQIEKTDADIERLHRQLVDCYPTAPISGVIVEKYVSPGELLGPGKAIAKIANLDTLWVKVYLSAMDFAHVKQGGRAKVSTESGGTIYSGEISWTSSEAEFTPKNVQTEKSRANLVYAVKVTVPNSDGRLKIGMPVFVTLEN